MNRFQKTWVVVVASLSLSMAACVSDEDGSSGVIPDSGEAFVDARPIVLPDANLSSPDANVSTIDAGPSIGLACTLDEVEPLITCAAENCLEELGGDGIGACLLLGCGVLVLGLSSECSSCLLTALADTTAAIDACVVGLGDVPSF